jgi:hypothetical protein
MKYKYFFQMGKTCSVKGCKSDYKKKIMVFKVKEAWLKNNPVTWKKNELKNKFMCHTHFNKDDILGGGGRRGTRFVRPGAKPIFFPAESSDHRSSGYCT